MYNYNMEIGQLSSIQILPQKENTVPLSYDPEEANHLSPQILETRKLREDNPVSYYVKGYLYYVIAMIPLTYAMTFVPEFDTHSEWYTRFYERDTYYTSFFSPGKFLFWLLLAAIGFTFVVVVNLDNTRGDPFMSRDGSHKDIKILIPLAVLLYFISSIIFLRGKYDMRRDCPIVDQDFVHLAMEKGYISSSSFVFNPVNLETQEVLKSSNSQDWSYLFNRISSEVESEQHCHTYSRSEVFWYNYWYVLMYFLGLNFTHLDQPPFNQITLEWDIMKNWPWYLWAIFLGIMSFIFLNFAYLLMLYQQSGVILTYIVILAAIPTFFILGSYYYGNTRELHVHHYVLGC
jgi:hypothetical protein